MSFNKGIDYNLSGTLTLGNSNFKYLTNTSYAHLSGALSASVISGSQITGSQILGDYVNSTHNSSSNLSVQAANINYLTASYISASSLIGYDPNAWTQEYYVDFRTLGDQTFNANGNYTIDGKTWTIANYTRASNFGVGSSFGGLKIGGDLFGIFYSGVRASAYTTISIKELIGQNPNFKTHYRITFSFDINNSYFTGSNFNYIGVNVESPTYNANRDLEYAIGLESSALLLYGGRYSGAAGTILQSSSLASQVPYLERIGRLTLLDGKRRIESASGSQLSEISNIRTLGEHYTFNAFGVTGSSQPALYFFNSVFSSNWFNNLTFKELLVESRLKEELVFIP